LSHMYYANEVDPSLKKKPLPKKLVLLSCTHLFHDSCFQSFEHLIEEKNGCPICRTTYYS